MPASCDGTCGRGELFLAFHFIRSRWSLQGVDGSLAKHVALTVGGPAGGQLTNLRPSSIRAQTRPGVDSPRRCRWRPHGGQPLIADFAPGGRCGPHVWPVTHSPMSPSWAPNMLQRDLWRSACQAFLVAALFGSEHARLLDRGLFVRLRVVVAWLAVVACRFAGVAATLSFRAGVSPFC